MRRIFLFSAAVCMMSCGIHEIGGEENLGSNEGIWGGPVEVTPESPDGIRTTIYMTVLDYKKGYDWRSDQAVGSVKCSLAVYADGVPRMKVPVGDEHEVSSDPDMHRMMNGHLYTDYSTESETVIKRDGRPLFRYAGREIMCGMATVGEDVYTLGASRDGKGFSFRRNGEVVLERENGSVIGSLVNDGDVLCFAFCEEIRNAEGSAGRYYAVVNGTVSQTAVRDDIKKIWDVYVGKDRVVYVASLSGLMFPVIVDGKKMISLNMPLSARLLSCRLFDVDGKVGMEGIYRYPNGLQMNGVWVDGHLVVSYSEDKVISAMQVNGDGVFCVMNPSQEGNDGVIYRDGETYDMPEGYLVMGNSCLSMIDGILHVGLSSMDGKYPIVWKDARMDTLKINGYISSISSLVH